MYQSQREPYGSAEGLEQFDPIVIIDGFAATGIY
jgi:hypothetical protein